ncbi:MAG: PTS lactose/cellobiose transporter subunit IIA [Peptoniphilaceae bacterium]|nr:PTS lactose/cellobiose transporter subunit IIA [Peptoniphilaceae bacterium]MDY6018094.1 PTS lactose/cellobiose transporter subunit IIA [Anaerococcus sp.]
MNEKDYEDIFKIIICAGDARTLASEAIDLLEEYKFDLANQKLKEAKNKLVQCHNIQTEFLNAEAKDQKNNINIFMIHAQDHFSMATSSIEMAERLKSIYMKISNMEEKYEKRINNV